MEFDVTAKNISMYYYEMKSGGGMVNVTVTYTENGEEVTKNGTINADFSNGWGSHEAIAQLFTSDTERDLHIKIEPQYNEVDTTKNRFTIYAFGIS